MIDERRAAGDDRARRSDHPLPPHRCRRRVPHRPGDRHADDVHPRGRQRDHAQPDLKLLVHARGRCPSSPIGSAPTRSSSLRSSRSRCASTARCRCWRAPCWPTPRSRGCPLATGRPRRVRHRVGQSRRIAVRVPHGLPGGPHAAHATTWPSAPVRTCAPARRWPGSKRWPCSKRCWRRFRGCRSSTGSCRNRTQCSGRTGTDACRVKLTLV